MTMAPLLIALAVQSPAADSLLKRAPTLPESALVAEARAAPLVTREAVSVAIHAGSLDVARRLADAHAIAWRDPFLAHQVARFAASSPERRAHWLWADSVRLDGNAAYGRDGAAAAIRVWHRALERAVVIADTVLIAATSGNIGQAFRGDGQLDSAQAYLRRAGSLAAAAGDRRVEATALLALGVVSHDRRDLAAAGQAHSRALTLYEAIGDTRGIAAAHNELGNLAWEAGDLDEAGRRFESALALNRRDGRDAVAARNLFNLAGLAGQRGEFAQSQRMYRDALAVWRSTGARTDEADALYGLGQLEIRRGDYPAAQATLQEALEIYDRTGPIGRALDVRRALAGVLAARGELQGAVDLLRDAEDLARAGGVGGVDAAGLALASADLAFQLNALSDAERLYEQALRLYRQAGDRDGEAESLHGLGFLRLERDDSAGARTAFESALRIQEAGGHGRAAALTRLALGRAARAWGDTALARSHLLRASADLERLGEPVGLAAALGERAALEADRGLPAAAEALYRDALARLDARFAPDVAWRLHAGLAQARRRRGALDDAARELRAAVAEIERAGSSLALPERRAGFMADKWEAYTQLALVERGRGLPGTAFEVSERLRSREMLEMLGRGRIDVTGDAAGQLAAREQDLRRRIAELTEELSAGTGPGTVRTTAFDAGSDVVREALLAAQDRYEELYLEIRERAPEHAALVSPEPAGWREIARRLEPDQAFIEYLVSDSGSIAFVVAPDTLAVVDLDIARRPLADQIRNARFFVDSLQPGAEARWRVPFSRLYRHLIAPIEDTGLLTGTTRLLIAPHGELHHLPFAALIHADGDVLIQRYELATTPSATVWLALGDRPARPRGKGILGMAPRPDALPGSRREVEAVGRLAGSGVQILMGDQATATAFRDAAPSRRILHLATYGALNRTNPLFSFVEFAPGGTEDHRLEVHEVFGLDLGADLVVLSACHTGLGSGRLADVPPGDDWVGLTQAFLHAGADRVVATLWAIEDQTTASLMQTFYEHYLAGADPSRALADAQRAMLAGPDAHPFYWAAFVVVEGSTR